MIEKDKFHVLNYIKREEYTGSMSGMRYMLKKKDGEDGTSLEVILWPEPFGYAKTPESKKQRMEFPFSQEGLEEAVDWMNEQHEVQRELWEM
ncbi:hypothetical protein [Kineothrix sp. MB12-C1]|uniref:hypothetical protein n=1 Tax=Kineothrix sp. MB12-C1 TaxID=3070215 RepID=UPI0027D2E4EA|nr:hypothetical protein [Kineothrix sp. MB12-C1]WMC93513.1 hypothetical protein RBB56_04305 [Kineothrix sp. MB12-C1]